LAIGSPTRQARCRTPSSTTAAIRSWPPIRPKTIALDVVGYTLAAEPTFLALFGMGVFGIALARRYAGNREVREKA
jgi:hypothetical protein